MKRLISIIILASLVCAGASAQTKSETRSYEKAVAKPTIKAFDKFLKKYPSSVYAAEISARRDTLLSISPYSFDEAADIISGLIPGEGEFRAFGERKNTVDYIYAIRLDSDGALTVYSTVKAGSSWKEPESSEFPLNLADGMHITGFADSCSTFRLRDEFYFTFNLLADDKQSSQASFISAYFCPDNYLSGSVSFTGTAVPSKDKPYCIRGRIDDFAADTSAPQIRLLMSKLQSNPLLEKIPDNVYYTELAIRKWQEENPSALKDARQIHFISLPEVCSLSEKFTTVKGKQQSAKYTAAIIDIMGYTVIVVKQKADGAYTLAWAEPQCKDKYKDRLLNSIYFTSPTTLTINYYHGSRTFSYSLNLSSQQLKR